MSELTETIQLERKTVEKDGWHRSRNDELGFNQTWKVENGNRIFDLYLTDEAKQMILERKKRNRKTDATPLPTILKQALYEMSDFPDKQVHLNPFAHIYLNEDTVRQQVIALPQHIQEQFDIPLAIKTHGIPPQISADWRKNNENFAKYDFHNEDLTDQFITMRKLSIQLHSLLTPQQRQIVEICPVYGLIKFPDIRFPNEFPHEAEFLFMKGIVEGEWIGENKYDYNLMKYFGVQNDMELRKWLLKQGLPLRDAVDGNILYTNDVNGSHYTIIDQ